MRTESYQQGDLISPDLQFLQTRSKKQDAPAPMSSTTVAKGAIMFEVAGWWTICSKRSKPVLGALLRTFMAVIAPVPSDIPKPPA